MNLNKKPSIKVESKEKAFWIRAEQEINSTIDQHSNVLKFQKAVREMIREKIKAAK